MKLTASRPTYYDVDRYGVPVNTLDSIHSISTFCANPMWQQLPRQGIWPRKQEIEDYIALFRYLGYLLATPDEYFSSASRAKAVMESMTLYELSPSASSKVVGHNFVECLRDVPPMNVSREFVEAGSRWMNGKEVCDFLGLGRPGWYYYSLMLGQCMLSWGLCWMQRGVPMLDRWVIKVCFFQFGGQTREFLFSFLSFSFLSFSFLSFSFLSFSFLFFSFLPLLYTNLWPEAGGPFH